MHLRLRRIELKISRNHHRAQIEGFKPSIPIRQGILFLLTIYHITQSLEIANHHGLLQKLLGVVAPF
jgi:hypothetical protein